MLLWAHERRGGFVKLSYQGEILVKGWGRVEDFHALPAGELRDRLLDPITMSRAPQLKVQGSPRLVKTTREVTLLNGASNKARTIGRIERDTETYVLDIVVGWASVLPRL